MKFWKPFERWTKVMGNRIEHQWHADFELQHPESLVVRIFKDTAEVYDTFISEQPPPGKRYCVHLKICLEEFSVEGGEEA